MSAAQNVNKKDEEPLTQILFDRQGHSFTLSLSRDLKPSKDKEVVLSFKITSKDMHVAETLAELLKEVGGFLRKETKVTRSKVDQLDHWIIVQYDVSDIKPDLVSATMNKRTNTMLKAYKRYFDTGLIPYRFRDKAVRK